MKNFYGEGVETHQAKPGVSTSVQTLRTDIKPEVEVLQESIAPTVSEDYCVCPDGHRQLEEKIESLAPNPIVRYMVMGEVLGAPKCKRRLF